MKKILVLQLARLGDIFMSWPTLRALRRAHPDARIHFLTRPRFEAATKGLDGVDVFKTLPTAEFLEPLLREVPAVPDALARLDFYLETLRKENYDQIINLTFSPFSSYLVSAIAGEKSLIAGYTRHGDGWLAIPDEVSSYFYAQAGIGRANRIHLVDLFASAANVDLTESDWDVPNLPVKDFGLSGKEYVVIHVGASESSKAVAPFKWSRILKHFVDRHPQTVLVLIGTASETHLAHEIRATLAQGETLDLTGKTEIQELFGLIAGAKLLVGADSAPLHMASLTSTPTLNISFPSVNFWETGPRAVKSYVYKVNGLEDLPSAEIGRWMSEIVRGQDPLELIRHIGGVPAYELPEGHDTGRFAWELIRALYLGGDFPMTDDLKFCQGIERLREMNDVILEQLEAMNDGNSKIMADLLDRGDEVMATVAKMVPETAPLVRWVQTEKTRIPPGTAGDIRKRVAQIHQNLGKVLRLYIFEEEKGEGYGTL